MAILEVDAGTDRDPAIVKRASQAAEATRLAHEAEVLETVRGNGVVELLEFRAGDEGAELRLAWAGHHTMATIGAVSSTAAARLVLAVAETVTRLHSMQIAHTRISPDHVILGVDGQPVLCGFSRACRGDVSALEADVVALGDLLALLVGGDARLSDPLPERRLRRRRSEPERAALLTLADRASAAGLGSRPTAATFAEALRGLVPEHEPVVRNMRRGNDIRRVVPFVAGIVGVGLVVAGVRQLLREPPVGPQRSKATAAAPSAPPTSRAPSTSAPPSTPPIAIVPTPAPAVECSDVAAPSADTDGDGCPDAYSVAGSRVTLDGTTFEVGAPGDLVAIADWDCDGTATPALVRPSTGEVFVFSAWARPGGEVTVGATTVVAGATGIHPGRAGARCPDLVVTRQGQPPHIEPAHP